MLKSCLLEYFFEDAKEIKRFEGHGFDLIISELGAKGAYVLRYVHDLDLGGVVQRTVLI